MAIRKLLIANRGEIVVRIIRTCRRLGITSVAIYSDADREALHVREADEAYPVGPAPAAESYLSIPAILDAARRAGADAIHPGYGFLSERAPFAAAVLDAGLIWVGPSPQAIRALGDKVAAKQLMAAAGVPTVPGYYDRERGVQDPARLQVEAARIGFPVLIKAAAGGGGKGMRVVESADAFEAAAVGAAREAQAAFGDPTIFLEKYIRRPRHIEFQIIGDTAGTVLHLGERECSIQRRYQKVLEEAPSPAPALDAARRAAMGQAAVRAGQAAGYTNAGTVEFILDAAGAYYFLEMNTRLQVEHPVTEAITWVPPEAGRSAEPLDLVALQIRIAEGAALPFTQEQVERRGHAIEVRVYAEDPAHDFLPATGRLQRFAPPVAPWIRNENGVAAGDLVSIYYDPLLSKLIVHGPDRPAAVARLAQALAAYEVTGVTTNLGFLFWLAGHPAFRAGDTDTGFLARHYDPAVLAAATPPLEAVVAAAAYDVSRQSSVVSRQWAAGSGQQAADESAPDAMHAPQNSKLKTQNSKLVLTPWRAGVWRQGGQGLCFRYQYLPPGLTLAAEGAPVVSATFSRAEAPGTWHVRAGDYAALLRVTPAGAGGVELERLDGSAPGPLAVRVWAPSATRRVVAAGADLYRFTRVVPLTTDTLQIAPLAGEDTLAAPMPGKIIEVLAAAGDHVTEGQRLVVMEAMKMEFTIKAPHAGLLVRLPVRAGQLVEAGALLAEVTDEC